MKYSKKIFLFLFSILSVSCFKEEDEILDVPPYHGIIMGSGEHADPTYADQIWFDLSSQSSIHTQRTLWDLGFYSGPEFRVILNTSLLMAAAPIEGVTELNQVNSEMVSGMKPHVKVANFDTTNTIFVDNVKGDYLNNGTAIAEISANPAENKVYLLNLGRNIFNGNLLPNTAYPAGSDRGWKKIKINREGSDGYRIQYANLDDTNHQEFVVTKNPDYNFSFFSIVNQNTIGIQPTKQNWDFCFTVFTNVVEGAGTYIFSDFIMTNHLAGTGAYKVMIPSSEDPEIIFSEFKKSDIDETKFIFNDHTAIGDKWRDVFTNIYGDRFFILKDPEGKYFKLRFIRFKDDNGFRGYFQFEFMPLE